LIVGKALGGGILPVSAFLAKEAVMSVFTPGSHGSTFGGNPLAVRIGLEVLTLLEEGDLIACSAQLGEVLLNALKALKHPLIKEVRGKGLWVGLELYPGRYSARWFCEQLMQRGILTKETHETVIRFAPPFVIERETLLWSVDQFNEVLNTCKE